MGSMQGEVAAACVLPAVWSHRPPCSDVATARGGRRPLSLGLVAAAFSRPFRPRRGHGAPLSLFPGVLSRAVPAFTLL